MSTTTVSDGHRWEKLINALDPAGFSEPVVPEKNIRRSIGVNPP
ncbi:hypothetical protein [Dactylosporangium sp. CA-092794]